MMKNLPEPIRINNKSALEAFESDVRKHNLLAVDTESNSLYVYHEQVCLIQASTRDRDYIIDPLAFDDLSALGDLIADPSIEKVFHAAEYDIMTMKRDFGFTFANLFDTMFAARLLGRKKVGYGSLLEEMFGIRTSKKYQRADWGRRPLPDSQIRYAQMDTHYLPEIRDRLLAEIRERGREAEAREIFHEITKSPPAEHTFDPDGFWSIDKRNELSSREMAILRELYLMREDFARRKNRPPFKIMGNKTLLELARFAPRRYGELDMIHGMSGGQVQRYGDNVLKAIRQGINAPLPSRPPQPPRPPEDVYARYDRLDHWRKRNARQRGVSSEIIVSRDTLWHLAYNPPDSLQDLEGVPGLGPWRRQEYGRSLLKTLKD
jgi:ribonuclease D